MCVLVSDAEGNEIASAEGLMQACLIHHFSGRDIVRSASAEALQPGKVLIQTLPLRGFRNNRYDEQAFKGHVPPSDDGRGQSMITTEIAERKNGETVCIFLNAHLTPVSGTLDTLRVELAAVTLIMLLFAILVSWLLSRRITQPLVETTEAAGALSRGEYTPVKHMNYKEIRQLNERLSEAAKDLHRVETMQRELVANISHDLRTPLTLIQGYAEVMRDIPGENNPENMQVIIDETKRLTTLVNSVLDLSRIQAGVVPGNQEDLPLTKLVRDILGRYSKLIEQDTCRIVYEPAEEVNVHVNRVSTEQVIYNLVNNAITYTGEDHTVRIVQEDLGSRVRLHIIDSGEGIAPEDLEHIWERYYRGSKPHKRAAVGSGLGLNIVRGILENAHEQYGVVSEEGKGSDFWFDLPKASDNTDQFEKTEE